MVPYTRLSFLTLTWKLDRDWQGQGDISLGGGVGLALGVGRYVFGGSHRDNVLLTSPICLFSPDLVPKEVVEKWLDYLQNELPTVAFKASTQHQVKNLVSLGQGHLDSFRVAWARVGGHDLDWGLQLFGN